MAWDRVDNTITFECDDCGSVRVSDISQARLGSTTANSDFITCWQYVQGTGWRTFKRVGHDWTFHCVACGPAAEVAHREHKRMEAQRDRLKVRNARD